MVLIARVAGLFHEGTHRQMLHQPVVGINIATLDLMCGGGGTPEEPLGKVHAYQIPSPMWAVDPFEAGCAGRARGPDEHVTLKRCGRVDPSSYTISHRLGSMVNLDDANVSAEL